MKCFNFFVFFILESANQSRKRVKFNMPQHSFDTTSKSFTRNATKRKKMNTWIFFVFFCFLHPKRDLSSYARLSLSFFSCLHMTVRCFFFKYNFSIADASLPRQHDLVRFTCLFTIDARENTELELFLLFFIIFFFCILFTLSLLHCLYFRWCLYFILSFIATVAIANK